MTEQGGPTPAEIGQQFRDRNRYPMYAVAAYLLLTAKAQGVNFTDDHLQQIGEGELFWTLVKDEINKRLDGGNIADSLPSDWDSFQRLDNGKDLLNLLHRSFPKS